MKLLLLIGLALAWWGWRSARLGRISHGDLAAAAGGIVAVALLRKGAEIPALLAAAAVAGWIWWRMRSRAAMPEAEALSLLGLKPGADEATIRAAHRLLIARAHPDAGGSDELSARLNAARDALIGLNRNQSRAS